MIGKQFGAYKIESKIGAGGMGVVYKALDTELDRPVAIKMVLDTTNPDGSAGEEAVGRFLREAKAASRLQHPAIVHIYQFGVEENTRYLAMEFIEGQNLRALINRRPMSVDKICEIGAQVADGLAAAHEMGIVHRDLKLENIMVTTRGQAKILDFGLAKLAEQSAADDATMDDKYFMTQLGTILGTASSMAPEQALGKPVDAKADVFSLGVVLYEMATGMNPFLAQTAQSTIAKILNHQPELVSLVNPSIPPELERIIHLCLRKEAKQRPTAAEVTNILKRLASTVNQWGGIAGAPAPSLAAQPVPAINTPQPLTPAMLSLLKPPSSKAQNVSTPSAVTPAELTRLRLTYWAVKAVRMIVGLITLVYALTFFFYMLIGANVVRPEVVQNTIVWRWSLAVVVPVLDYCTKIFAFNSIVNGWNLILAGLGIVALFLRYLLMMPIEGLEFKAKAKYVKAKGNAPKAPESSPVIQRAADDRLALLRQYSEGQRKSVSGKKIAVLSIDVVGWSRMKMNEDEIVAEHAYAEYKKFVDRILRSQGPLRTTFTNDGVLCAMDSADKAVISAQSVLRDLSWFNEGVHRLPSAFHVRCGVNIGELEIPEDRPLDEVDSPVIDLAGKMQKTAAPDTLRLSGEVLALVADSGGFEIVSGVEVDGKVIYEWRPAVNSFSKTSAL